MQGQGVTPEKLERYLGAILESTRVLELWEIADRGMPVYAHTIDVGLLCLAAIPELVESFPYLHVDAILIGVLLHDLSKLSARRWRAQSHSQIMSEDPTIAVGEALDVL